MVPGSASRGNSAGSSPSLASSPRSQRASGGRAARWSRRSVRSTTTAPVSQSRAGRAAAAPPGGLERGRAPCRLELIERVERQDWRPLRAYSSACGIRACTRSTAARFRGSRWWNGFPTKPPASSSKPTSTPHVSMPTLRRSGATPSPPAGARQDLVVQAQRVPVEAVVELDRVVGEAVDLVERRCVRRRRARGSRGRSTRRDRPPRRPPVRPRSSGRPRHRRPGSQWASMLRR